MDPSKLNENVLRKSILLLLVVAVSTLAWSQKPAPPKPSAPAPKPTAPARPAAPAARPSAPAQHSAAPARPATQAHTMPTRPTSTAQRPGTTKPGTTPAKTGPRTKPVPVKKAVGPATRPTGPGTKPTGPAAGPSIKPTGPGNRPALVRSVSLSHGGTAKIGSDGKIRSVNKNGMHIEHNLHGGRKVVSDRNGKHIVSSGKHGGYVQRPLTTRNGHSYYARTSYDNGVLRSGVYRGYAYGGHTYYGYEPSVFYGAAFYGWAYNPWPGPLYWDAATWGWGGAPWFEYYGFTPYPTYAGPAFWLTDYLIATNLQAAYAGLAGDVPAMPTIVNQREGQPGNEGNISTWAWNGQQYEMTFNGSHCGNLSVVSWDGDQVVLSRVDFNGFKATYTGRFQGPGTVVGSVIWYPPGQAPGNGTWTAAFTSAAPDGAGINVIASQPWNATGMQIVRGQTYTITASGIANFSSGNPNTNVSPAGDGRPACFADPQPIAPGLPCMSLVGKIGPAGTPFYIGPAKRFVASAAGELFLGMNDNLFGDNSGAWVANVRPVVGSESSGDQQLANNGAGTAPTGSDPVVLTPEAKSAIAEEVKAQLQTEKTEAAQPSPVMQQAAQSSADEVPPALDPARRNFVVSVDLAVTTVGDGQECSLTGGDVITRLTDTPDADQKVNVSVTSSKKSDCATGKLVAVSVDDLQEMRNHFQEQLDAGLKTMASKQGTHRMPKAPGTSTVAGSIQVPPPDKTAAQDLQEQQQQADQTEAQVRQEAGAWGGGR